MTCTLSIEGLKQNLVQAVEDWFDELPVKTEDEAGQLAETQGTRELVDQAFPQPYDDLPPRSWVDEDE
jgi:hypothetical protein